jgi:hypothetical protein
LYGIGFSAGETADHARSTALVLEDRFIQQRPLTARSRSGGASPPSALRQF